MGEGTQNDEPVRAYAPNVGHKDIREVRILVTGANGFIGANFCRLAMNRGHWVVSAVRRATPEAVGNEVVALGDISKEVDWTSQLQKVDCVLHLAGRAHVLKENASDPLADFRRVNVDATLKLAKSAAVAGVKRFVFVSSIGVNGEVSSRSGFSEMDSPAPRKPYAVSKWEAEQSLHTLAAETGIQITIARPPLVYGPNAPGNFALLKKLIVQGLPLPFGSTANLRTLVSVQNLVDFLLICLEHPMAAGETFLVGDNESVSTQDLVRDMCVAADRHARIIPFPVSLARTITGAVGKQSMFSSLFETLVVDSTKARGLLGWKPRLSLQEGLARVFQPSA